MWKSKILRMSSMEAPYYTAFLATKNKARVQEDKKGRKKERNKETGGIMREPPRLGIVMNAVEE